jgi:hypothetical protein
MTLAVFIAKCARHMEKRIGEIGGDLSQIQPLLELTALMKPRRPLPRMQEYAIAPDMALFLYGLVRELVPKQIVETGSGVSTLVCAYALESLGAEGKILSLDHDGTFAAKTRAVLEKHGLAHRATVVHAPLRDTTANGQRCLWYAQDALADVAAIDLVVDDGPPKYVGANARYAALHVLAPKMTGEAPLVLGCVGPVEDAAIARWCRELPFEAEPLRMRKSNVILRRKGATRRP